MATALDQDISMLPKSVSKPKSVVIGGDTDETAGASEDKVTVDIPSIAREDVKKQRGIQDSPDALTAKFDAIINARDINEAIKANGGDVFLPNGRALEPSVLEKARNEQGFRGQLLQEYVSANRVPQADPAGICSGYGSHHVAEHPSP